MFLSAKSNVTVNHRHADEFENVGVDRSLFLYDVNAHTFKSINHLRFFAFSALWAGTLVSQTFLSFIHVEATIPAPYDATFPWRTYTVDRRTAPVEFFHSVGKFLIERKSPWFNGRIVTVSRIISLRIRRPAGYALFSCWFYRVYMSKIFVLFFLTGFTSFLGFSYV